MSKVNIYADGDPLVSDVRLERVFVHLTRLVSTAQKVPEQIQFATKRQEAILDRGDGKPQGPIAVFIITSPHPGTDTKALVTPAQLVSIASMPFEQWADANAEYRHYANLADPLRPIFAGLLREHLNHRQNLESLKEQ